MLDDGCATIIDGEQRSGVSVAHGKLGGVPVVAFCTDAPVMGGAMGADGCKAIVEAIECALSRQCPVVGIWHSGGARLAEGVQALDAVGSIFAAIVRASGKIAQVSVILGPAAGGAAYGPALTDVIIMADKARMFITGPDVVRSVTGEEIDMESLGGPHAHGSRSGVAHLTVDTDEDAFVAASAVIGLLARPGRIDASLARAPRDLAVLLPDNPRRAYDVHPLIFSLLDDGPLFEMHAKWARSIVTGLGRLAGRTVGVIANNPIRLGGCLDSASAEKAARFVRMCDAFGIALVVLVDVPGYLPGVGQEWDGVIRRGAKLLYAFAEASVPRVTVVTRKAYGGAYIAMNARCLGASAVFAWPNAQCAVMGPEAAVGIVHRKALAAVADADREALRTELVRAQIEQAGGLHQAQGSGLIDRIIDPAFTRTEVAQALAQSVQRRGSHGNIPL
jgi:acetyl-CoA/propionyl-CoA carboxylase carboxyl transferase subunit